MECVDKITSGHICQLISSKDTLVFRKHNHSTLSTQITLFLSFAASAKCVIATGGTAVSHVSQDSRQCQ